MVRKYEMTMFDDLTGEPAETTVVFGHRGGWYEIDLTTDNADYVRSLLSRWSTAGRRREPLASSTRTDADRARAAAIREWAMTEGITVAAKGRLPHSVIRAYDAALRSTTPPAGDTVDQEATGAEATDSEPAGDADTARQRRRKGPETSARSSRSTTTPGRKRTKNTT